MIRSVTVTNPFGEKLEMTLKNPEDSGFFIKSIDGLGPVKANVNTSEYATTDGARFNSARLPQRNIVLNLGFLWNPTIEDTRLKSYKFFPIKQRLDLNIQTDKRNVFTSCYVESNEPDIFSDKEGCQISLVCPNPYFYSEERVKEFSFYKKMFKFPFSNMIDTSSIVFGELASTIDNVIPYSSSISAGAIFVLDIKRNNINTIRISNGLTHEVMELETPNGQEFQDGDRIIISTVVSNKYISLISNGHNTNIINYMKRVDDQPLMWIRLMRGNNVISVSVNDSEDYSAIDVSVNYYELFEGI